MFATAKGMMDLVVLVITDREVQPIAGLVDLHMMDLVAPVMLDLVALNILAQAEMPTMAQVVQNILAPEGLRMMVQVDLHMMDLVVPAILGQVVLVIRDPEVLVRNVLMSVSDSCI